MLEIYTHEIQWQNGIPSVVQIVTAEKSKVIKMFVDPYVEERQGSMLLLCTQETTNNAIVFNRRNDDPVTDYKSVPRMTLHIIRGTGPAPRESRYVDSFNVNGKLFHVFIRGEKE